MGPDRSWKKDYDVTFDIIYIYIYLSSSSVHYWFKRWLKHRLVTSIMYSSNIGNTLEVCAC